MRDVHLDIQGHELQTGDIVQVLDPLRARVQGEAPVVQGTCLAQDLPTDVTVPVGTEARVELSEGRWGEDLLILHFALPGLPSFDLSWGLENWPRMFKVRDADEPIRMTYGLPFPGDG